MSAPTTRPDIAQYRDVSVLFADIVGFTPLARSAEDLALIVVLHEVFCRFDDIVRDLGMRKIKTIGDAYMAAAGVPNTAQDHAAVAITCGQRMLDAVYDRARRHQVSLDIRVGINSGPVMAGVIGRLDPVFDLWGHTVNVAARMESSGIPGRIQVTESVKDALVGRYQFAWRDREPVKGCGEMDRYLLLPPDPVPNRQL